MLNTARFTENKNKILIENAGIMDVTVLTEGSDNPKKYIGNVEEQFPTFLGFGLSCSELGKGIDASLTSVNLIQSWSWQLFSFAWHGDDKND